MIVGDPPPFLASRIIFSQTMNAISEFPTMSKYTAFRCPEDLLELAKVKAKKDRRSLSNYIITLIEKDVQSDEDATDETKARRK
jgi:predicted HicB family RNase H-like nuclease